ncbi:MAG TPA: MbnP family protein, partial [Cyclobacteriaceae bacterium]|nr:MbnP family protein [Cyclobacteriaceae bacterium]
ETTGDTVKIPETYFLIDERNANSKKPTLTVPAGQYYAISFLIGVDSARNVSGAQTGALDPANGMFWDRTNGYIMAKFEGTSSSSPLPGNVFTYHVGGFKEPYNVISRRHFKLGGITTISPDRKTIITFRTDARTWLSNPHTITFAADPSCTAPGPLAKKISENYFKMFDFISVKTE